MQGVMVSTPTLWLSSVARTPGCYIGACRIPSPRRNTSAKYMIRSATSSLSEKERGWIARMTLTSSSSYDASICVPCRPVTLSRSCSWRSGWSTTMMTAAQCSASLSRVRSFTNPISVPTASSARYCVAIRDSSLTTCASTSATYLPSRATARMRSTPSLLHYLAKASCTTFRRRISLAYTSSSDVKTASISVYPMPPIRSVATR